MEKSLYIDIIQKYFPQLVTSVVEKINGKNTTTLPYFYKDLLVPEYSTDGRWASILADYNRVAADVVALDSELPLKSRDTLETASGNIPKIGMKLYLTEKQMKDIDAMIAQRLPETQILNKIFNDLPRCIQGVYERIEDMFLSELSTGVGVNERNNGTGVRIDVGYYEANQFGVKKVWSDASALILDDIEERVMQKALDDQNTITDVWLDDTALRYMYKNTQVREQYAFNMNFVGQNVPTLDLEKIGNVFLSRWGIRVHRVARKIKTELNGKKETHAPWQDGMVVFTCDEKLGTLVWTSTAESTRPVGGVEYQTADDFILLSKYSKNDPLREFTSSQAMVVPIVNNVDRIYTMNSKNVVG